MKSENETPVRLLETRVIRMNPLVTGISVGLIAGLLLFAATNILILKGGDVVGPHLGLIGQIFIGYRVTFVGSLIGFGYALVTGIVIGYLGATIYNVMAAVNARRHAKRRRS